MRLGAMGMRSSSWGGKGWKRGRKNRTQERGDGREGKGRWDGWAHERRAGKKDQPCTRRRLQPRLAGSHVRALPVCKISAQVRTRISWGQSRGKALHLIISWNGHITKSHAAASVLRVLLSVGLLGPSGAAAPSSLRPGVAVLIPSAPQPSGTGGTPRWLHPEAGKTVLPRSALASADVDTPRGARLSRPSPLVIVFAEAPRPQPPRRRPTTQWPPGGRHNPRRGHLHVLWKTHSRRSL